MANCDCNKKTIEQVQIQAEALQALGELIASLRNVAHAVRSESAAATLEQTARAIDEINTGFAGWPEAPKHLRTTAEIIAQVQAALQLACTHANEVHGALLASKPATEAPLGLVHLALDRAAASIEPQRAAARELGALLIRWADSG